MKNILWHSSSQKKDEINWVREDQNASYDFFLLLPLYVLSLTFWWVVLFFFVYKIVQITFGLRESYGTFISVGVYSFNRSTGKWFFSNSIRTKAIGRRRMEKKRNSCFHIFPLIQFGSYRMTLEVKDFGESFFFCICSCWTVKVSIWVYFYLLLSREEEVELRRKMIRENETWNRRWEGEEESNYCVNAVIQLLNRKGPSPNPNIPLRHSHNNVTMG